jgi:hypothetical protein
MVGQQQDSDDSVTDLDEIGSPTPSSPSSDEVHTFDYSQHTSGIPILDQSPDMLAPELYMDEEDDESTDSTTDSFDTAEPSSVASPSSPIHHSNPGSAPAAAPASTGKRRGRPRTNKTAAASAATSAAATPSAGGGRKRKADSINSESLLGTKKAKTSTSTSALIDRLPSSISAVELQGMSSAEYDAYFAAVSSKLSRHEIELAKLQRRRIKNRESASNSRVRKQDNLADLETQVQQLREQNEQLRQKALAIQSEQKAMSRELDTYKRLVREHLPPEFVPSFFSSTTPSSSSSSSTEVIHVSTRTGHRSTRTLARDVSSAALMCLVLFAMIWGTSTVVPGSVLRDAQLPFNGPSRFSFPVPTSGSSPSSHIDSASTAMAPVSSSSSALITSSRRSTTAAAQAAAAAAQAAAHAAHANSRPSIQGDGDWLAQVIHRTQQARINNAVSVKQEQMTVEQPSVPVKMVKSEQGLDKSNEMAVDGVFDSLASTHTTRTEAALLSTKEPSNNDTIIPARLSNSLATSSSSASTAAASSSEASTQTSYSPEWKQNTTYIMCDSMQQVIPPSGAQPAVDPTSPLYVSLWVNPSALSASPIPSASKDPFNMDYLVQITCQIMSVDQLGLLSPSSSLPTGPALSLPSVLAESSS